MLEVMVKARLGDFLLDVSFGTSDRGVLALFGPSGSGKTSLVNAIAGLLRPQEGRIVLDGRVLFDSAQSMNLPPEQRRIGYVFQESRLFPHLCVRSNLLFGWKLLPAARRKLELDQVVELLGIDHLLSRRPAKLSGGEKQRVALGRALLTSPQLLLMDEPLASLDHERKQELLPFFARLTRESSIPIVYVSHDAAELEALKAKILPIRDGRLVAKT